MSANSASPRHAPISSAWIRPDWLTNSAEASASLAVSTPGSATAASASSVATLVPTSAGGEVFVGAGVNYRTYQDAYIAGSQLKIPDNGVNRWLDRTAFRIDGYALVDARIGYTFPGDRITMSAWGKNVFNTFNVQNKISYNNIITQATGMPGTYGVSLKVRLK